jgi:hypothetical protein
VNCRFTLSRKRKGNAGSDYDRITNPTGAVARTAKAFGRSGYSIGDLCLLRFVWADTFDRYGPLGPYHPRHTGHLIALSGAIGFGLTAILVGNGGIAQAMQHRDRTGVWVARGGRVLGIVTLLTSAALVALLLSR